MTDGFDQSVNEVRSHIERSSELSAFLFAAQSGEKLSATKGINPSQHEFDSAALLGIQLLSIANDADIHPAVLGHEAVRWALEQLDSDDPLVIQQHDEDT